MFNKLLGYNMNEAPFQAQEIVQYKCWETPKGFIIYAKAKGYAMALWHNSAPVAMF